MKRNFTFSGLSVIPWEGRFLDVHNAYDLTSFGTDLDGAEVSLGFTRNRHAINPDELPVRFTIVCVGNVMVAFNDLRKLTIAGSDFELAYFDEGCDWTSYIDEELAKTQKPLGLHLLFGDSFTARIFCDEATLTAL